MDNNHDAPSAASLPQGAATLSPETAGPPALSPRRLAARRANAKKSTGPRTPQGKHAVRFNALKHGFFAGDVVNAELDGSAHAEEFNAILDALLAEFQPQSAHERILIDEVASCCWRVRRLLRHECRVTWIDEDERRRWLTTETSTDTLLASIGRDTLGVRRRTEGRLERSGLDTLALPNGYEVDKIVRFERGVKRNLYRALDSLERIRAARQTLKQSVGQPSDAEPSAAPPSDH